MNKQKPKKLNNRGSTMVETLVSFTVVAIVLASLYAIVSFSTRLWMNSVDASNLQQSFTDEMYRKNPNTELVGKTSYKAGSVPETDDGEKYANFILVPDDNSEAGQIYLNNISADYYFVKDEAVDNEKIAAPKAIIFKHKKQLEESENGD